MRLINTTTLELKEFFGKDIPQYAILSHVWGAEEVSYQEWAARESSVVRSKSGYLKIVDACKQAVRDDLGWLWADTNCIDKTSSAELTEAINSMFRWYADSKICYAYLYDVIVKDIVDSADSSRMSGFRKSGFRKSRWFTRGWTLQELLAPKRLIFYSQEWRRLGDRTDDWVLPLISETTSIEVPYLTGHVSLSMASAAKRMSWLSRRVTTREEDIAYCMLGIFEVNMPLLYGEGSRAFIRLQEEIIKFSNDHTLFCWSFNRSVPRSWVSILAPSPRAFAESAHYVPKELNESLTPYSMTNLGLSIQLPMIHTFTHPFVLLNAGPGQQSMDKRACLAMAYSDTRSTLMLQRHWYPENPVNLYRFDAHFMRRHPVFVSTRPSLISVGSAEPPSSGRYAVLTLMETTNQKLFNGSNPIGFMQPINSGCETPYVETPEISTYPKKMFNFEQSVLHLPPVDHGARHAFACLLAIHELRDLESGYFIFFGVKMGSGGKAKWICHIVTCKSLAYLWRDRGDWDLRLVFDLFVSEILKKSDEERLRASVPDGSLILKMGRYLTDSRFRSMRVAWLLGAKQDSYVDEVLDEEVSDVESTRGNAQ
ncbi:heterokaryon incompatibility protein-domain-containing protein [Nemania sp. NC0429]|nr:heterokaryon incompatibility protein-domain-containing protein [Nemania sp. NC0429]